MHTPTDFSRDLAELRRLQDHCDNLQSEADEAAQRAKRAETHLDRAMMEFRERYNLKCDCLVLGLPNCNHREAPHA